MEEVEVETKKKKIELSN